MAITRKTTLLALVIMVVCAVALAGCGGSGGSASAGASGSAAASSAASASAAASSSAASAQQADEQAQPYVGTWKADSLTLEAKTNSSDKETNLDIPVSLELANDMTGTLTVGDSTQAIEWEIRYWESLKVERAVITLHEPFTLGDIVCDAENLMLEFGDSKTNAHLFYHWTSSVQSGVKLGVDTTVEKAS